MRRRLIRRTLVWQAVGLALLNASAVHAQLPTGAVVANGTAPISSDGTTMTITNTDGAIIDWQSFSIGPANTVQFVQGASSRVLNRVGGTAPSSILGQLNSSGAVYLLNPNGIVFGANAAVNVGGLIASTLAMSDSDFINDKRLLSNNASAASVINNGTITSSGDVVLAANTVTNNGTISAPGKTVNLAAGRAIQEVDSANLTQDHIVLADSATPNVFVVLDTAADHTATNLGSIVANDGSVNIYGALVSNSGTVDASSHSGAGGYVEMIATQHINLSDTSALTVDAKTDGGDIYLTTNNVRSYTSLPTDPSGVIDLGGTISAQTVTTAPAPVYGRVSVDALAVDLGNVQVSTGQGELVITQPGILVDATASGITGAKLATQLDTTHVALFASSATATTASLSIQDDVSWANHTLTLFADGDVVIYNPMNGAGTASLALAYGQGGSASDWLGSLSIHAPIGLNEGGGFSTHQGYDGSTKAYEVITTLTKLQNVQASASNQFALGANIDATNSTFTPIGNLTSPFNKELWGLGHVISNLSIDQSNDFVGLFGYTADQAVIHDLGLVNATIVGSSKVGALVGQADSSWIYNVFADADVSGGADTGGLVGLLNGGTVQYAYASGSVFGADNTVGGLVGNNNGWIENSYANAAVSISATAFAPGGLVGVQGTIGSTLNSFWDTDASGQNSSDGGAPLSSVQIKQKSSYANWYDISSTGESPTRWRIYEDSTAPLLNVFLTPLTITAGSETKTYDGSAYVPSAGVTLSRQVQAALLGPLTYSGDAIGATDAGSYLITPGGHYSSATGYDISFGDGLLVIDPKLLTLSLADKTYDGSTAVFAGQAQLAGVLSGDAVSIQSVIGDYADKHVGTAKTVNLSDVVLTGADAANYTVDVTPALSAGITPLALSVSLTGKTYDGSTAVLSSQAQLAGVLSGDAVTIHSVTGAYADKHVGTAKTVNLSDVVLSGTDAANYTVDVTPAFSAGITPLALSVGLTDKTYDASTAVLSGQVQVSGVLSGDAVTIESIAGDYADKHVGTAKTVNLSDVVLTGADAANYTVDVTPALSAGITPLALSVSLTGKTYDASTAVLSGQAQLAGVLSGDAVTIESITGDYADKHVGTAKTVNLSDVVLTGADAANYTVDVTPALSAGITPLALSVSLTGKTYDASTAVLSGQVQLAGVLSGDAVTIQSVTGDYADKHVGTAKTVNLSDVVLTGPDAANYTVDVTPALSAGITPLALSLSLTDKTYDGSVAVLSGQAQLAGVLSGDAVSIQSVTGDYADKHVGTAKTVNLSDVALTGADAANYTVDVTPALSAGITPLALSVSLTGKTYDASTAVLSSQAQLAGVLSGDAVTIQSVTGDYADKNVGTAKSVTLSSVVFGGADGQNYTPVLANTYSTDILQLASVAWVGTSGNWSDAANWAGGALPEGSNVANVVIPSLAVVTLDANVADTTLSNLSSEGTLIIDGGHLIINTSLSSATLNLLSGWIHGAGSVSVTNGLTMDTGVLNVSGNIAMTSVGDLNLSGISAGGSMSIVSGGRLSTSDTLTANTITIAANSIGAAGAPVLTTTSSLDLSASGGGIWLSNTGAVTLTSAISQGAVVIDAYGGLSTGADQIRANAGSVTLRAHSPLRVGSGGLYGSLGVDLQALSASGNSTITIDGGLTAESSATISLASYDSVSLNSDISGGSVIVSSTSGDVKLNGGMITAITGDITLSATQGTVLNAGAQYSSQPNISDTVSAAAALEAASNASIDALTTSTSFTGNSTTFDVSVQETNVDASAMSPSTSTETADTSSSTSASPAQASTETASGDTSADTSSETSAQAPAETSSETSSDSADQAAASTTPTAASDAPADNAGASENTDTVANGSDGNASASGEAVPSGAFQQANALIEQRHEIKTEALAQALDALEKDPNAADLEDCTGADDASLCIATAQAHGDVLVRITPGARLPQIQRKIALLFGVNAYQDPIPSLKTPTNDVTSVANILRQQQGYDVRVFENPTKRDIVQAVNRVIQESTANDSVLLYYAGHGYVLPKTKTGYWIPTDGDARNPANWISNNDVARMLHNLPARQVLLISDSCYSGKLAEGDVNDLAALQASPRDVLKKRSVVVFSSGGDEPVSDAGVGENSIFAHALVGAMAEGDGVSPGQALASRVHKQVTQSFPQQPRYTPLASAGHQSGGDYLFERRARTAN